MLALALITLELETCCPDWLALTIDLLRKAQVLDQAFFSFFFLLVATCGQSEALNAQCGSCNQSKQGTVLMEEQQNAQIVLL